MGSREWWLIGGMALVTFSARYVPLALAGRVTLPAVGLRLLRYIPPAVLAAIIAPGLILQEDGGPDWSLHNSRLVAGLAAAVVAWRTRNLLLTLVVGMGLLWLWQL